MFPKAPIKELADPTFCAAINSRSSSIQSRLRSTVLTVKKDRRAASTRAAATVRAFRHRGGFALPFVPLRLAPAGVPLLPMAQHCARGCTAAASGCASKMQ